jgi:transposase
LGITKRGDRYLRKLLVHGARSALRMTPKREDPRSQWIERLRHRSHENVAAVALAAKTARTLWAVLAYEREYDPKFAA